MPGAIAYVIGVGPGDPVYLPERSRVLLTQAKRVAGFSAALDVVKPFLTTPPIVLTYRNQHDTINALARESAQDGMTVVCCYGDPNVSDHEFLARLRHAGFDVRIVPGISSVQIACAYSQTSIEHSLFITFHKRGDLEADKQELLDALRQGRRHVLVLPRPWDFMPGHIAQWLAVEGIPADQPVQLFERLTLPDERVHHLTVGQLAGQSATCSDLSIVLFRRRSAPPVS